MDLLELQLLEERIKGLLNVVTRLKLENQQLKGKIEGNAESVMIDMNDSQKQRIKAKISEMLELIEKFQAS